MKLFEKSRIGEPSKNPSAPSRLQSLDALRGFDMFLLIGFGGILRALPQVSDNAVFNFLAQQCSHPKWHGFTLWDLIFPLFIFIVGVAMPYSFGKRLQRTGGKKKLYVHIVVRTIVLFVLGLVFWGTPGGAHPTWGYYSVLYRIGISYFFGAIIILNAKPRGQAFWAFGLVIGYWLVMRFVPVPGHGAGDFSEPGRLTTFLSQKISDIISPNFKYVLSLSLFPTVSMVLFGALAGQWLDSSNNPNLKTLGLILVGIAFVACSVVVHLSFPINKKLWSTSFTFLTCGLSLLLLSCFYWLIDVRGYRRWAFFFIVVGMNSIAIYMGSRLIDFNSIANVFISALTNSLGTAGPLVTATTVATLKWLFLYYLYRNRIFFKI
jgi:predicted acyltransferase